MKALELTSEEISGFDLLQLRQAEHDLRHELVMMRMSVLKQQKLPLKDMRLARKNIARIKTFYRQKLVLKEVGSV